MTSVLLDTHTVLWWQAGSDRLSSGALTEIERSTALLSPISCWEVSMLVDLGRINLDRPVDQWVRDLLARTDGPGVADLTPSVAAAAGQLSGFHGDPADRLIYATAREQQLPLVTKDDRLRAYAERTGEVTVIW